MAETEITEAMRIVERYERRAREGKELNAPLYSPLAADVYLSAQEKERAFIRWIKTCGIRPLEEKRLLEIGCGNGDDLLRMIRLGFRPENLTGNELLPDRLAISSLRLPSSVRLVSGDARKIEVERGSFDIVYQSMAFTSILDDVFRQDLATHMWALIKPGGGILWYDFIYKNPKNSDVRPMPLERVRKLFPEGSVTFWRVTLAPPISRRVTKIHPSLYTIFNTIPALRTHVLCWIRKP